MAARPKEYRQIRPGDQVTTFKTVIETAFRTHGVVRITFDDDTFIEGPESSAIDVEESDA